MNKLLAFHDIYSVAYADFKGVPVEMRKDGNRVVFLLPDDPGTYRALGEFNNNPTLPVLDFVTHLKKIRSQMISMR